MKVLIYMDSSEDKYLTLIDLLKKTLTAHEILVISGKGELFMEMDNYIISVGYTIFLSPTLIGLAMNESESNYSIAEEFLYNKGIPCGLYVKDRSNEIVSYGLNHGYLDIFDSNELPLLQAILDRSIFYVRQSVCPGHIEDKLNDLVVDTEMKMCTLLGKKINLTGRPLSILFYILKNRDRVCSREEIMEFVWDDPDFVTRASVEVNINKIRKELGPDVVKTVSGKGYAYGW